MENELYYSGKPKKFQNQRAFNLTDMNIDDTNQLAKDNRKEIYNRATVYGAAGLSLGVPGVVAGTGLAFLQTEQNRKKRLREYGDEQNDIGFAVNEGMTELEEF